MKNECLKVGKSCAKGKQKERKKVYMFKKLNTNTFQPNHQRGQA